MREQKSLWYVPRYCAAVVLLAGFHSLFGRSFPLVCALLVTASLSGSATGALIGVAVARSPEGIALRIHWRELAVRGAASSIAAGWGCTWLATRTPIPQAFGLACGVGAMAAVLGAVIGRPVLNSAESAFARALGCVRKGDRDGARVALQEYLAHAEEDPVREARLPAAERFLAGETNTLVVATELQAASAPAGRGSEVSAAARPEGSGTELVGAEDLAPPYAPAAVPTAAGDRHRAL